MKRKLMSKNPLRKALFVLLRTFMLLIQKSSTVTETAFEGGIIVSPLQEVL